MKNTEKSDHRIANITYASVYPYYVEKVVKKGRTEQELLKIIKWLTGYSEEDLKKVIENKITFKEFFEGANLNPSAEMIKGVICGYRVEDIPNPLTKKIRMLDKIVDELAKGKTLEKIMRI